MKKQAAVFILIFTGIGLGFCSTYGSSQVQDVDTQIAELEKQYQEALLSWKEYHYLACNLYDQYRAFQAPPQQIGEDNNAYQERVRLLKKEIAQRYRAECEHAKEVNSRYLKLKKRIEELLKSAIDTLSPEERDQKIKNFKSIPQIASLYAAVGEKEEAFFLKLNRFIEVVPQKEHEALFLLDNARELHEMLYNLFRLYSDLNDKVYKKINKMKSAQEREVLGLELKNIERKRRELSNYADKVEKNLSNAQYYVALIQEGKNISQTSLRNQHFNKNLIIGMFFLVLLAESLREKSWVRRGAWTLVNKVRSIGSAVSRYFTEKKHSQKSA